MNSPKKLSSTPLFCAIWGKSATLDVYRNPRTGTEYDWPIFHVNSPSVNIVFALTTDWKVITIRQFRHAANRVIIELPGGLVDENESAKESLRREFIEETGYKPKTLAQISREIYFEPGSLDFGFRPFIALDCKKVAEQELDPNEDIEVVLIGFPDWEKMIQAGQIFDAKSIVTTYLAKGYLGK